MNNIHTKIIEENGKVSDKERDNRIMKYIKYQQFYSVDKKATNREAKCGACRKTIDKGKERAYINKGVKTQEFKLCLDCLALFLEKISDPFKEDLFDDNVYKFWEEEYGGYKMTELPTVSQIYVDGYSGKVFVRTGNVGSYLLENISISDNPIGHDLDAVILALINMKPYSECIIYSNNKVIPPLLNQSYQRKNRKNEELIGFIKTMISKKHLDIVFSYYK